MEVHFLSSGVMDSPLTPFGRKAGSAEGPRQRKLNRQQLGLRQRKSGVVTRGVRILQSLRLATEPWLHWKEFPAFGWWMQTHKKGLNSHIFSNERVNGGYQGIGGGIKLLF